MSRDESHVTTVQGQPFTARPSVCLIYRGRSINIIYKVELNGGRNIARLKENKKDESQYLGKAGRGCTRLNIAQSESNRSCPPSSTSSAITTALP